MTNPNEVNHRATHRRLSHHVECIIIHKCLGSAPPIKQESARHFRVAKLVRKPSVVPSIAEVRGVGIKNRSALCKISIEVSPDLLFQKVAMRALESCKHPDSDRLPPREFGFRRRL